MRWLLSNWARATGVLGLAYRRLSCILGYEALQEFACQAAFVKHLEQQKKAVSEMVHEKRKSIVEEQGFLATIKIGDWVEVESNYSPGLNSDGGSNRLRVWVA